jgi:hypothetical protein
MSGLQARKLAVECVADCLSAQQADGFQSHERTDWYKEEPDYGQVTDTGFIVTIAGHEVQFRATIKRKSNDRDHFACREKIDQDVRAEDRGQDR